MLAILLVFLFFSSSFVAQSDYISNPTGGSVMIFKSDSCGHCAPYVDELLLSLKSLGYDSSQVQVKDFLNDKNNRQELANIQEKFGVPLTMQGHMIVLIDNKYLFEGHVPAELIRSFLQNDAKNYEKIVVTQDSMTQASSYKLLLANRQIKECEINTPLVACENNAVSNPSGDVAFDYGKLVVPALIVLVPLALIAFLMKK